MTLNQWNKRLEKKPAKQKVQSTSSCNRTTNAFWNNKTKFNIQKVTNLFCKFKYANLRWAYAALSWREYCVWYDLLCLQQPVSLRGTIWLLQRKNLQRRLTPKRFGQSTRGFAGRLPSKISTRYPIFAAICHLEQPVNCINVFCTFLTIKTEPSQLKPSGFDRCILHVELHLPLIFRKNWPPNGPSIADCAYDPSTGHNSQTAWTTAPSFGDNTPTTRRYKQYKIWFALLLTSYRRRPLPVCASRRLHNIPEMPATSGFHHCNHQPLLYILTKPRPDCHRKKKFDLNGNTLPVKQKNQEKSRKTQDSVSLRLLELNNRCNASVYTQCFITFSLNEKKNVWILFCFNNKLINTRLLF